MIRINLLPYREERRRARQQRFVAMMGLAFVIGALICMTGYWILETQITAQNTRNAFLTEENAKLDRKIAEVQRLNSEKQNLLARKLIVERLQSNRSETVRLFDSLVGKTPDGVYLSDLKQTNNELLLHGYAQSNTRISTLMRHLNDSDVFEQPVLVETKRVTIGHQRFSEFTLLVDLTRLTDNTAVSQPAASALTSGRK